MSARHVPLVLACGCHGEKHGDGFRVVFPSNFLCAHRKGDFIDEAENAHLRRVNDEWDRAERDYLEQPL